MSIERRPTSSAALAILLASLGACTHPNLPRDPLPYSPDYSYVDGPGAGRGVVRKGYDRAAAGGSVLVPDACLTPDVTEQPLYLPPGCANNLNLQKMVEREGDLLHGRATGPAMAAPVARAARRYMDEEPRAPAAPRTQREDEVDTTGGDLN